MCSVLLRACCLWFVVCRFWCLFLFGVRSVCVVLCCCGVLAFVVGCVLFVGVWFCLLCIMCCVLCVVCYVLLAGGWCVLFVMVVVRCVLLFAVGCCVLLLLFVVRWCRLLWLVVCICFGGVVMSGVCCASCVVRC